MRLIVAALLVLVASASGRAGVTLVEDGKARCVIVTTAAAGSERAAEDLKWHLDRMAGCDVSVITEAQAADVAAGTVRIFIGAGAVTEKLGPAPGKLAEEQYRIRTFADALVITGRDGRRASKGIGGSLQFGVNHLLDQYLGVRWLWPGELGTVIPKASTIKLPDINTTGRPALLNRSFSTPVVREGSTLPAEVQKQIADDAARWNEHHDLAGGRSPFRFGHAFGSWYDKYHAEHPDWFATAPAGSSLQKHDRMKLCVSNPGVAAQVVAEWKQAGSPGAWNVCPNDGFGFCTCDRCRALDDAGEQTPRDIYSSKANLTKRYLHLWNALLVEMKKTRPDVKLCTYAYSAYRDFPAGATLEPGLVIGFVHTYDAYDQWRAWSNAGAEVMLRPNWWHSGACAPYMPLHAQGAFFKFAQANRMVQFHFDMNTGYFGTQALNYYLIARLSDRPQMSVDEVIDEWCAGFGASAPVIRRYIDYWEKFTGEVSIDVAAGGGVSGKPGLYAKACDEHQVPRSPLSGSWIALPYIYTDAVIAPAMAMLAPGSDDPIVNARIEFLRDGLRHLVATRDTIAIAYLPATDAKAHAAELAAKTRALLEMRDELTVRRVLWGDVATSVMTERGVKPLAKGKKDLRGL